MSKHRPEGVRNHGEVGASRERFLDLTLVMLLVGLGWTALSLVDLAGGTLALALPAELIATDAPVAFTNRTVGPGTLDIANDVVSFRAPIFSLRALVYLATLALQMAPAFVLVVISRRIVSSVVAGKPFAEANVGRIRALGTLTITFGFLCGALQWGLETWVAASSAVKGFGFGSSGEWNYYVFLLGVVIIGLAEVFRHGRDLQSDADLTV